MKGYLGREWGQDMDEPTKEKHREALRGLFIQRYISETRGEKEVDVKLPRSSTAREIQFALVEKHITNARAGPQAHLLGATAETALILEPAPATGRTATSAAARRATDKIAKGGMEAVERAPRRAPSVIDEALEASLRRGGMSEETISNLRKYRYSMQAAGEIHKYSGMKVSDILRLKKGSMGLLP